MKDFWRHLRQLKEDFPLRYTVKIRTFDEIYSHDGDSLYGSIEFKNGVFVIWILRNKDDFIMRDTLWHEWTHALIWPRCRFRHSKRFWETYGKIYSHYQDQS